MTESNHSNRHLPLPHVLTRFLDSEAAGGIALMAAAFAALIIANSSLSAGYFAVLHAPLAGLDLLHWINDGLMAVFFLFVGLEIKREFLEGQLSSWSDRALPGIAAAGGVVVPALIYFAINFSSPATLKGWAIPTATDIAFALGVLSLLGPRVPVSLKVFLTALAIIDDLIAVVIIAIFYTAQISWPALAGVVALCVALYFMNRAGVANLILYIALGFLLWYLVLVSGIHATIAGVLLSLMIPLKGKRGDVSPLHNLEHALSGWVAFFIVPVFGFANAGVSFAGLSLAIVLEPLTLGITAGLFLGKQLGVFGASLLAIRSGFAVMPAQANFRQLYGVALLCGVGFTMSLFIGLLSFPDIHLQDETKIGVLIGSGLSAVCGYMMLKMTKPAP